jgi:hypothetical protein
VLEFSVYVLRYSLFLEACASMRRRLWSLFLNTLWPRSY